MFQFPFLYIDPYHIFLPITLRYLCYNAVKNLVIAIQNMITQLFSAKPADNNEIVTKRLIESTQKRS